MKKNMPKKRAHGWGEEMRYGERKFGAATCSVVNCMGVPERMRKEIREVIKVYCPPGERGQGHATELLKAVCKEADSKRMILLMTVGPFADGPLSKEKLADWYETTFDFQAIQQEPLILARMFNPFPESGLTEKIGTIITEGI